jgi:8-oxo-dGTP pyrophosphatase MutT (NUDIX family)
MHRQLLIRQLEDYQPLSSEGNTKGEILNFVREHENCFDRELSIGHITGSAWLLNPEGNKVLLTHHKKLDRWMQLGGHSDGEANTMDVALREAQEESGIDDIELVHKKIFDIDVHEIPERKNEKAHYHFDIRFLLQAKTDQFVISDESNDLGWFSLSQIKDMNLEESVQRMITKWEQL